MFQLDLDTYRFNYDTLPMLKKTAPKADTTALEKEIYQLVYQLYGLTEEEIKIVEGGK